MEQHEFIQMIYDQFRSTGRWPRVRDIQVEVRHLFNVRKFAAEIGANRVVCENRPEGVCFLHLEAIATCRNSDEDVQNFVAAVRIAARRYIGENANRMTGADFEQELKLATLANARLGRILPRATDFWSTYGPSEDGGLGSIELTESVMFYENVQTISQFFEVRDRVRTEAADVSATQWSYSNPLAVIAHATRASVAESRSTSVALGPPNSAPGQAQRFNHFWTLLHPSVVGVARSRFDTGHFADAVFAAFKQLNACVKETTSPDCGGRDGADLMTYAFSPKNRVLIFGDLDTESGMNEQKGYMQIFAGGMTGIRNPKAHVNVVISPERALHQLFLASLLFSKLDEANARAS